MLGLVLSDSKYSANKKNLGSEKCGFPYRKPTLVDG